MIDWEKVLKAIKDMSAYFAGCCNNAAEGSAAKKQFGDYIGALIVLDLLVRDMVEQEDDGK